MEYDIYGNVYKRLYIDDSIFVLRRKPHLYLKDYSTANELFKYILDFINKQPHWYPMCNNKEIMKLQDKEIYFTLNKDDYNNKIFEKYKFIKTIDIDRKFKDGDLFTYNNNDYKVTYKYNSDKDRHELYINYTCEIIIDYELDDRIANIIDETNELIKNHNESLENQIKELKEEPKIIHEKIPVPIENKSWIIKLINKIKGVK